MATSVNMEVSRTDWPDSTSSTIADLMKVVVNSTQFTSSQEVRFVAIFGSYVTSIVRREFAAHKGPALASMAPLENDQGVEVVRHFLLVLSRKYVNFASGCSAAILYSEREIGWKKQFDLAVLVPGEVERFPTTAVQLSAEYVCWRTVHAFRIISELFSLVASQFAVQYL